jgi:hypothetical protein
MYYSLVTAEGDLVLAQNDTKPRMYAGARPGLAARKAFYSDVRAAGSAFALFGMDPRLGPNIKLLPDVLESIRERAHRLFPDPDRAETVARRYCDALQQERADLIEARRIYFLREPGARRSRQYSCGYKLNLFPNVQQFEKCMTKRAHAWLVCRAHG